MCKTHLNELVTNGDTSTLKCPFCQEESKGQNYQVSKVIEYLLLIRADKFSIDSKYEKVHKEFKTELSNIETIIRKPENFISDEIHQFKEQVNLDRDKAKTCALAEIDKLADDLIRKLETFEVDAKKECKSGVKLNQFIASAKSYRYQLNEFENN